MTAVPSSQVQSSSASSEGSCWYHLHMGQPPDCACCKSAAKEQKKGSRWIHLHGSFELKCTCNYRTCSAGTILHTGKDWCSNSLFAEPTWSIFMTLINIYALNMISLRTGKPQLGYQHKKIAVCRKDLSPRHLLYSTASAWSKHEVKFPLQVSASSLAAQNHLDEMLGPWWLYFWQTTVSFTL